MKLRSFILYSLLISVGCASGGVSLRLSLEGCEAAPYDLAYREASSTERELADRVRQEARRIAAGGPDTRAEDDLLAEIEPWTAEPGKAEIEPDGNALRVALSIPRSNGDASGADRSALLRGELDSQGNVLSFFLPTSQKNVLSLLFQLPDRIVRVGESWELPVSLTALGNGYYSEDPRRFARAKLSEIRANASGGPVARLVYVVDEDVAGTLQLDLDDEPETFRFRASYVGAGSFDVESGCWAEYVGYLALMTSGPVAAPADTIYALRPGNGR